MELTKSQKFFCGCLAFLAGIALAEIFQSRSFVFIIVVALSGLAVFFPPAKNKKYFAMIFLLLLGNLWASLFAPQINQQHISYYNGREKTFQAIIVAEPDARLDHQKLTARPTELKGKVLLKIPLYPEYQYGDLLEVDCDLRAPEQIDNFKYDKFLARAGIYSVCYQPRINLLASGQGKTVVSGILKLKQFMQRNINLTVAEPEAALVSGILIGARQGILPDLTSRFNVTGITHIIAISGYNITIIVAVLLNIFKNLCVNRRKAIWGIGVGLFFFVILTGAGASVVRAAVMGGLVLLAKQFGRANNVKNVLILSAVAMTLFNPKILVWDAGFQLSFLSTIGLVYLSPRLERLLRWLPEKLALRENLASTLSAIIFTLPLILFQFGRLSIVAPVVNLLVLPVIPIAMLVGFIQFLGAVLHPFLGQIIGWASWLLLGYVVKVVEIFSSFSWAAIEIKISWFVMLIFYLALFALISWRKKRPFQAKNAT